MKFNRIKMQDGKIAKNGDNFIVIGGSGYICCDSNIGSEHCIKELDNNIHTVTDGIVVMKNSLLDAILKLNIGQTIEINEDSFLKILTDGQ